MKVEIDFGKHLADAYLDSTGWNKTWWGDSTGRSGYLYSNNAFPNQFYNLDQAIRKEFYRNLPLGSVIKVKEDDRGVIE